MIRLAGKLQEICTMEQGRCWNMVDFYLRRTGGAGEQEEWRRRLQVVWKDPYFFNSDPSFGYLDHTFFGPILRLLVT